MALHIDFSQLPWFSMPSRIHELDELMSYIHHHVVQQSSGNEHIDLSSVIVRNEFAALLP